jgi:choline kinase
MKVVILAAGRGSRLGKLTDDSPKCFTVYRGKPLISWILESVSQFFEQKDIHIVVGYREMDFVPLGINLIKNKDWGKSNIMGSLTCADKILSSSNCLIIYSDIFFEASAIKIIKNSPAPAVLSVSNWVDIWSKRFENPLDDLENFEYNFNTMLLTQIGNRAASMGSINGQFAGIFTITPSLWQMFKEDNHNLQSLDTTSALQKAILGGAKISVINYSGHWAEIDTLSDLERQ